MARISDVKTGKDSKILEDVKKGGVWILRGHMYQWELWYNGGVFIVGIDKNIHFMFQDVEHLHEFIKMNLSPYYQLFEILDFYYGY